MSTTPSDVTVLLRAVAAGVPDAADRLIPVIYGELRRMAGAAMRGERDNHTLSATALVHEAWLRLSGPGADWQNRSHFFGAAAQAMRRVLVEHARERSAAKRRRDRQVTLDPSGPEGAFAADPDEVLEVHEALERLAQIDPRQARLVELRYFVGFSIPETAEALGISMATVKRDWVVARAWLHRELGTSSG